jgi:hypothetical protein
MGVVNFKVVNRSSYDASFEEQKRNHEKMMKTFRAAYTETGGVKDRIDEYQYYCKPSEQRRKRAKVERNRAMHKKANNERA